MVNSRNKGASFEREVVNILNQFFTDNGLDYSCKRNLDQYQEAGQCDVPIPFHAVECKSYKEGNWIKTDWWRQVCDSAKGDIPVLIYKFNRVPIRVCVPLYAITTDWEQDNQKIAVLPLAEWLDVLKLNWNIYEQRNKDK